jgi:hypothetical protein
MARVFEHDDQNPYVIIGNNDMCSTDSTGSTSNASNTSSTSSTSSTSCTSSTCSTTTVDGGNLAPPL